MAHETTYILLLRGINVGGRNKLPTAPFCEQLKSEGFSNVRSYLASGNLLLDSAEPVDVIQEKIRALIRRQITEEIPLLLLEAGSFLREADLRPAWWREPMARRDVLFLLDEADPTVVFRRIREMPLRDEVVSFGERVVFWGKFAEETYSRTAYHRLLLKESFYPHITIRNGRTFDRIAQMTEEHI
jgi:uncharacterized protein (DUF1697 family)